MLRGPFLTDLDPRAEVKGSIDPLGAMSIWTRLGRRVVGNLTTVTTSIKDFKTVILGFALVGELRRKAGPDGDVDGLAAFLRWEQLAAYTRAATGDREVRGWRRVRRTLSEGSVVPISAERDCQILANQKTYGLWGLFSVASRASGLLEDEANELTPVTQDVVSQTWKRSLSPIWDWMLETISEDTRRFNRERHEGELKQPLVVWRKLTDLERRLWSHYLVDGGPADKTAGRQAHLARLLRDTLKLKDFAFTQDTVEALAKRAAPEDEELSERLLDITAAESVLAPAEALFGYLQTLNGQPVSRGVDLLRHRWPKKVADVDTERFATLSADLAAASGNQQVAAAWLDVSRDLADGAWDEAIPRLLLLNKLVMDGRNGAAWVADENGILRVRYRDDAATLPEAKEVVGFGRNRYFIGSLRSVTGMRLQALRESLVLPTLLVSWDAGVDKHSLSGTVTLSSGRVQHFVLRRETFGEHLLVRCVSPVGRLDTEEILQEAKRVARRIPEQIGIFDEPDERGRDLTVEEEVLLGDRSLDAARVRWLVRRVTESADRLEHALWDGYDASADAVRAAMSRTNGEGHVRRA
jgi:hypothetical protein